MNPFLDGWSAVKNLGLHSALPCVILGLFNICYVLVVAGHVLASSLLEASILLALLAVTLPRVPVQSLLPLLAVGVLVVIVTLPYGSENILPATKFLLGLLAVMERSSVLRVVDGSFLEASSMLALVALLGVLVQFLLVLSTWPSENILLGVLAVMVRSSVLREDGGHSAPCRGRLDKRVKWIVTFVSLLRTCLISHLHWFRMHVCFFFIPPWCLKIRVSRTVWSCMIIHLECV